MDRLVSTDVNVIHNFSYGFNAKDIYFMVFL